MISNKSGQALTVVILLTTAFGGAYLAWSYVRTMQMVDQGQKTHNALNEVVDNVANRAATLLAQATSTSPAACATLMTSSPSPLEFRNIGYQQTTPLAVPLTVTYSCSPSGGGSVDPSGLLGCLLKQSEVALIPGSTGNVAGCLANGSAGGGPVASLTLTVQQIGTPDPGALVSTVDIAVSASTVHGTGNTFHSVSKITRIALQVPTLSNYNLVLLGPGTLAMNAAPSSTLEIKGRVLMADTSNPVPTAPLQLYSSLGAGSMLLTLSSPATVASPTTGNTFIFDSPWDIQRPSFVYENDGTSSQPEMNLTSFSQVFKGGINTGVFSGATLPINDSGDTASCSSKFGMTNVWEQRLDFVSASIGESPITIPNQPVPPSPSGDTMWALAAQGDTATDQPGQGETGGGYGYSTNQYTAANVAYPSGGSATSNVIPSGTGDINTGQGIGHLAYSCYPDTSAPFHFFLFQRITDNLTINYATDLSPGPPISMPVGASLDTVLCGLIAANEVTINLPSPVGGTVPTYYFFGLMIAKSVKITGGPGTLIFVNPMDNTSLASNPFPAFTGSLQQTEVNLAQAFMSSSGYAAHNFFVPVFQTLPPDGVMDAWRPNCPFRSTGCCGTPWTGTSVSSGPGPATDPTDAADKGGYVCPCFNGGDPYSSTAGCTGTTFSVVTAGAYCLNSTGAAFPQAVDNEAQILLSSSPAGGNFLNLYFVPQVVQ